MSCSERFHKMCLAGAVAALFLQFSICETLAVHWGLHLAFFYSKYTSYLVRCSQVPIKELWQLAAMEIAEKKVRFFVCLFQGEQREKVLVCLLTSEDPLYLLLLSHFRIHNSTVNLTCLFVQLLALGLRLH